MKKLVLVVLLGALAWLLWGRAEEREPLTLSDSCDQQARVWCGYKLCREGRADDPHSKVNQSCRRPCYADYVPRCISGRSGSVEVSGKDHERALDGIRAIQDTWRP